MCELDIIFNFEKAYFILDEFLMGGEVQETSKQAVNHCIENSDMLQEVSLKRRRLKAWWFLLSFVGHVINSGSASDLFGGVHLAHITRVID